MDTLFRTPLLDLFRRGEAPVEVRILAARGAIAPRAHEQIALLVLLSSDPDAAVRQAAETTLGRLPAGPLAAFLARSDVDPEIKAFFAKRGIHPAADPSGAADDALLETDDGSGEEAASDQAAADETRRVSELSALPVADKVKRAMRGRREERAILIRDPNRIVAAAVLSSPKLNESEIEVFARMTNVSEEVLRVIGSTRSWIRKYPITSALVRNPKTPLGVSMPLLVLLNERDVKQIAMDRNLPEGLRVQARKMITASQSRRR